MADFDLLLRFVLDHARQASVDLRPSLYRALARICGDPGEEKKLFEIAAAVEKTLFEISAAVETVGKLEKNFAFKIYGQ